MIRAILILLALAACAAPSAPAPEPVHVTLCRVPWPGSTVLGSRGYRVVTLQDFAAVVDAYNDEPPKSDLKPDHVYIVKSRDTPDGGTVFLVSESCVLGVMPLTPEILTIIERGAI